ncbi:uncharacterized protein ABDE67_022710 [Symphorus nematophorus]
MVSRVLSSLVCVLCVILLPAVWAEYCKSYTDGYGQYHNTQNCGSQYCCGYCNHKQCCRDQRYRLNQDRCPGGTGSKDKKKSLPALLGSILGSILPIALCVGLVICCVAPCCFCYKKCRKGGNRSHPPMMDAPMQPLSPSGYQPGFPGYQPAQPGFGGGLPNPAPPPYMDNHNPGLPGVPYGPGQPMYPMLPGQLFAEPPQSDELEQPPYNPSYDPDSKTG